MYVERNVEATPGSELGRVRRSDRALLLRRLARGKDGRGGARARSLLEGSRGVGNWTGEADFEG